MTLYAWKPWLQYLLVQRSPHYTPSVGLNLTRSIPLCWMANIQHFILCLMTQIYFILALNRYMAGEILRKYWLVRGKAIRQHQHSYLPIRKVVRKYPKCTSYHYFNSDCRNQHSGFLELIYPVIYMFISLLILVLSFYLKEHGENSRSDNASSSISVVSLLFFLISVAPLLESWDLMNISLSIDSWFVRG